MPKSILVSYVENENPYESILVVGEKRKNQSVEIINAFSGAEATELWNRLIEPSKARKEKTNE